MVGLHVATALALITYFWRDNGVRGQVLASSATASVMALFSIRFLGLLPEDPAHADAYCLARRTSGIIYFSIK